MKTPACLIYSTLFFLFSSGLHSQPDPAREQLFVQRSTDRAQKISDQALLIRADDKNKAQDYILSQIASCSQLERSKPCESVLYFTLGYYRQIDASLDSGNHQPFLQEARKFYEKALEYYPDNIDILNNYRLTLKELGDTVSLETLTRKLIRLDPENKPKYHRELGDFYLSRNRFGQACDYYRSAFRDAPDDPENCRRIVDIYRLSKMNCSGIDLTRFAYACNAYGFPNLGAEILEDMIRQAVAKGDLPADSTIVNWVNIMAESDWLDYDRLAEILKSRRRRPAILTELDSLLRTDYFAVIPRFSFWTRKTTVFYEEAREEVSPVIVTAKIFHVKANRLLIQGDYKKAAIMWEHAFSLLRENLRWDDVIPEVFFQAASGLAKLYHAHPDLDTSGRKLDELVSILFKGKGEAYFSGSADLKRNYHTTLGVIFYDRKVLTSNNWYPANAEFQLEHALSENLGPIVNPLLRQLLGDVYLWKNEKARAAATYAAAIEDYLRLDQIEKAADFLDSTRRREIAAEGSVAFNRLDALEKLILLRKSWQDPSHKILSQNNTSPESQLAELNKDRSDLGRVLNPGFVGEQFFKGYTDLGRNARETNLRHMLYANALELIQDQKDLPTIRDYNRLQDIKASFNSTIQTGQAIEPIKVEPGRRSGYWEEKAKEPGYRTYSIINQDLEIKIPVILYDAGRQIKTYYSRNGVQQKVPNLEIRGKRVVLEGM